MTCYSAPLTTSNSTTILNLLCKIIKTLIYSNSSPSVTFVSRHYSKSKFHRLFGKGKDFSSDTGGRITISVLRGFWQLGTCICYCHELCWANVGKYRER